MKKIIFLCLVLLISFVNIYTIRKVKMQEKANEIFHHKLPAAKPPVSLTAEGLKGYSVFRLMCE
jgi:hypothetical protein